MEKMAVRIEWVDNVIRKILEEKEHYGKVSAIKKRMKVLQRQLDPEVPMRN